MAFYNNANKFKTVTSGKLAESGYSGVKLGHQDCIIDIYKRFKPETAIPDATKTAD